MGGLRSLGLLGCQPSQTYPSQGDTASKVSSRAQGTVGGGGGGRAGTEGLTISRSYLCSGICNLSLLPSTPRSCLLLPQLLVPVLDLGPSLSPRCSPIPTCLRVLGRKQDMSSARPNRHCIPSHASWVPQPHVAPLTEGKDRGRFGKGNRVRNDQAL